MTFSHDSTVVTLLLDNVMNTTTSANLSFLLAGYIHVCITLHGFISMCWKWSKYIMIMCIGVP